MHKQHILLLITDDPSLTAQMETLADQTGDQLFVVADVQQALNTWETLPLPNLILLDDTTTTNPGATCATLKATPGIASVPVVFLVEPDDHQVDAIFAAGAKDCIVKPIMPSLLRWRIGKYLERVNLRRRYASQHERNEYLSRISDDYTYEQTIDTDGQFRSRWISGNFETITGYNAQELNGTNWEQIIHPEDRAVVDTSKQILLDGEPHQTEYRIATRDGEIRWIRDKAIPVIVDNRVVRIYGISRDVTHDRQIQEALRKNRERLQLALEAAEVGIWDWDMSNDTTYFSNGWVRMIGYAPDEIDSTVDGWRSLIHPEDLPLVEAALKAHIDEGRPYEIEHRLRTKSGQWLWVMARGKIVRHAEDGTPLRMAGTHRDVNETRQMQETLKTSEERLKLALEAAEDGLWDWNLSTNKIFFSPSWSRMLGYMPDQIEGALDSWKALIHPDDLPSVNNIIEQQLEDRIPSAEFQYRIRTRSGKWLWVQSRGRVMVRDEEGRPLRMMGTQKNIDRLKITEDALRKSEERHRIISNTISDYAYAYEVLEDNTLRKDWSTQAFYAITGYTTEEMEGDGWSNIIHPEDRDIANARFETLLKGEPDITEFRIITKSGEVRWLRDHGQPIVDPTTRRVIYIYGAAQDITQRKRDEEILHRQTAELAARNEELDAFAYTVAHDLKNPISSMMGFASLVQNYYDRMDDEKIKEYLSLIMEGGYKLKAIINALLMLAGVNKMEQAEVEPLDMQIIVEDAKKRLTALIDETRGRITVPVELPTATGYGPWVEEIWMNYLSNALKYGGTPPEIEIGAEQLSDGKVRFWVRDNGRGLTEEEKERVFTPFTRLNHVKAEGHGLGLSVVERIVKKLGGEVGVESKVGEGSVFSFTLPRTLT